MKMNEKDWSEQDIENIVYALNKLGTAILNANKIVDALPTEELKQPYYLEINDLTNYFVSRRAMLKDILKGYIEKEKAEGKPVNFTFRKIYKSLNEELL